MLLNWGEAVKLPWGILLLYGSGLALASAFSETGLADWIGMQLTNIENVSLMLLLLILIASVNFLTEITSNLATSAMLLPVIVPVALIFNEEFGNGEYTIEEFIDDFSYEVIITR